MNYLYDVFLNYNNLYYDFTEWNEDDIFTHLKKVPILRVNEKTLKDFINYEITNITNELISEEFTKKGLIKTNKYLIISDTNNSLSIKIKNNKITGISSLLPDIEEEINKTSKKLEEVKLEYKIDNKKKYTLKTRLTINKEKYLKRKLKELKGNQDLINYLYYECENKDKDSISIQDLLNSNIDKLYEIIKSINV